jgi:hypothetical protein
MYQEERLLLPGKASPFVGQLAAEVPVFLSDMSLLVILLANVELNEAAIKKSRLLCQYR